MSAASGVIFLCVLAGGLGMAKVLDSALVLGAAMWRQALPSSTHFPGAQRVGQLPSGWLGSDWQRARYIQGPDQAWHLGREFQNSPSFTWELKRTGSTCQSG